VRCACLANLFEKSIAFERAGKIVNLDSRPQRIEKEGFGEPPTFRDRQLFVEVLRKLELTEGLIDRALANTTMMAEDASRLAGAKANIRSASAVLRRWCSPQAIHPSFGGKRH
jgi:hypothetical protein